MKLSYEEKETVFDGAVACIDRVGTLCFPIQDAGHERQGMPAEHGYITLTGKVALSTDVSFKGLLPYARKVFYPGDQLTITF